jgi:hypothetical protein
MEALSTSEYQLNELSSRVGSCLQCSGRSSKNSLYEYSTTFSGGLGVLAYAGVSEKEYLIIKGLPDAP